GDLRCETTKSRTEGEPPMALSQSALSELLEAFRTGDGVDMIRESGQSPAGWWALRDSSVPYSPLSIAAFQLSFEPAVGATKHRLAAKAQLALRNDYRRLLADAQADGLTLTVFRQRRDALARKLGHLDDTAPQTSAR